MPDTDSAMINDALNLLEATKPIVAKLVFGVLGADLDLEQMCKIRWRYADEFWSGAVADMKALRDR